MGRRRIHFHSSCRISRVRNDFSRPLVAKPKTNSILSNEGLKDGRDATHKARKKGGRISAANVWTWYEEEHHRWSSGEERSLRPRCGCLSIVCQRKASWLKGPRPFPIQSIHVQIRQYYPNKVVGNPNKVAHSPNKAGYSPNKANNGFSRRPNRSNNADMSKKNLHKNIFSAAAK